VFQLNAFVEEWVLPIAAEIDQKQEIPRELITEMGRRGYLTPFVPLVDGVKGMDMVAVGLINETIGRGCSSVRGVLTVQGMVALAIFRWETEEQKNHWLPLLGSGQIVGGFGLSEAEAGTDARSLQTTAQRMDGYFLINGHKKWISLGQIADVYLIFAKCNDQISVFLVERETPGLTTKPVQNLMGLRGSIKMKSMQLICTLFI
jgi:glutaryl-CoA dehydrogenase (non-decarboxylating)